MTEDEKTYQGFVDFIRENRVWISLTDSYSQYSDMRVYRKTDLITGKTKKHRDGGPAISFTNKVFEEWWIDGKRHREDGPALVAETAVSWWWRGNAVTFEEWCKLSPISAKEKVILSLKY